MNVPTAPVLTPAPPRKTATSGDPTGDVVRPMLPYGVGIDTHKEFIQVCCLVQMNGAVRRFEQEFKTTWKALLNAREWALSLVIVGDPAVTEATLRYTIESTGTYHMPVLLAWKGIPSVVNPVLAGPTRRKTDVLDARMLAHHGIIGLWPSSFIPERQGEVLRVLIGMRFEAGRNATRSINRIGNHVLRFGHTFGREFSMADMYSRGVIEDMCRGHVPPGEGVCPDGLPTDVRRFFTDCYGYYDKWAKIRHDYNDQAIKYIKSHTWPIRDGRICGKKLLEALISIPGIGEVSAMTWLAVVCDPKRFEGAKQVAAFCGADPSLKVSAGKVTSHIKRKGNARLHHVLKNVAAQLVRKHNEPIGQWGYNIQRRNAKGGWAKSINAVSRRLAVFCWQVHLRGEVFSYDKYKFFLVPEVTDVSVAEMELGSRYTSVLVEAGLSRSQDVARAFMTTLPQQKGIGAGCLAKVKQWLEGHRSKDLSSTGESSVGPKTPSSTSPPASLPSGSATRSTAGLERSMSSTGVRRGSSRSKT